MYKGDYIKPFLENNKLILNKMLLIWNIDMILE